MEHSFYRCSPAFSGIGCDPGQTFLRLVTFGLEVCLTSTLPSQHGAAETTANTGPDYVFSCYSDQQNSVLGGEGLFWLMA